MLSIRTLIEICFPASVAPQISDVLMWFVPVILGIAVLVFARDMIRHNLALCICGGVVLYFALMYGEANTQYRNSWSNLALGDAIWYNLLKLGGHNHDEASSGQITWEEYYYRRHILQQGTDLVCENAMPASVFNDNAQSLMATYAQREEQMNTLKAGLNGGTISHWAYRRAIDKMNSDPGPFNYYATARDSERDHWRFVIIGPFVYLGMLLAAMAIVYKPVARLYNAWELRSGTARFTKALEGYTHARSLDDMAFVNGPLKLVYPNLFVGEVPHDLRRGFIDENHPNLLHIGSTGSRLYLYSSDIKEYKHIDPVPVKRKFFFDDGPDKPEKVVRPNSGSIFERYG